MLLVVGTHNKGKIQEIRQVLGKEAEIRSVSEFLDEEPIEDGNSLKENALIKAKHAYYASHLPSFADDSGLFVQALNGAPGIHSSRYAKNDDERIARLLKELGNEPNKDRTAYFGCCIAYYDGKNEFTVEGRCYGTIITQKKGHSGFGYDPVFVPNGFDSTFAELGEEEKNKISHRALALELFKKELIKRNLFANQ